MYLLCWLGFNLQTESQLRKNQRALAMETATISLTRMACLLWEGGEGKINSSAERALSGIVGSRGCLWLKQQIGEHGLFSGVSFLFVTRSPHSDKFSFLSSHFRPATHATSSCKICNAQFQRSQKDGLSNYDSEMLVFVDGVAHKQLG